MCQYHLIPNFTKFFIFQFLWWQTLNVPWYNFDTITGVPLVITSDTMICLLLSALCVCALFCLLNVCISLRPSMISLSHLIKAVLSSRLAQGITGTSFFLLSTISLGYCCVLLLLLLMLYPLAWNCFLHNFFFVLGLKCSNHCSLFPHPSLSYTVCVFNFDDLDF